jgi:hypothetical protein
MSSKVLTADFLGNASRIEKEKEKKRELPQKQMRILFLLASHFWHDKNNSWRAYKEVKVVFSKGRTYKVGLGSRHWSDTEC